jgi:hypothetical protein
MLKISRQALIQRGSGIPECADNFRLVTQSFRIWLFSDRFCTLFAHFGAVSDQSDARLELNAVSVGANWLAST